MLRSNLAVLTHTKLSRLQRKFCLSEDYGFWSEEIKTSNLIGKLRLLYEVI